MLVSLGLSVLIAQFYKRFGKTAASPSNLEGTVIILCLTITFIMEVVGNSVARAFSLAGALSIVRFRNAIKETEDIALIFLVMAVGLATGSGYFMIAIISTLFILIVWYFIKHYQNSSTGRSFELLVVEAVSGSHVENAFKKIGIISLCSDIALIQTRIAPDAKHAVFVYRILVRSNVPAESKILRPLMDNPGIINASINHQTF